MRRFWGCAWSDIISQLLTYNASLAWHNKFLPFLYDTQVRIEKVPTATEVPMDIEACGSLACSDKRGWKMFNGILY